MIKRIKAFIMWRKAKRNLINELKVNKDMTAKQMQINLNKTIKEFEKRGWLDSTTDSRYIELKGIK